MLAEPASCEADDIALPSDVLIIIQFLIFFIKLKISQVQKRLIPNTNCEFLWKDKMRKEILLADKSSLQRFSKRERESLDYIYDIRYSPILDYELLIGSVKYGAEKIEQFIQSKIKSLENVYLDAVAEQYICYHTVAELVKKEIIEDIPITQMNYASMGDRRDLKQAIRKESVYAQEQFDEEKKISDILKKEIKNKEQTNLYIEFAGIIKQIGNPRTNQRRLIEAFRKVLSKYEIKDRQTELEKFIKDNIKNNRKSFKIELMQKVFLIEVFMEHIERNFNENAIGNIKLVGSAVNLTEEKMQTAEKIIANSSDVKISRKYPYTFFCYCVYLLYFHIEKCEFMIKTQVTNFTRDIRYLLHLPFCDIFLSEDKDLLTICKSINYEYFDRLNLKPEGFQKFHPKIMTAEELLAQIN